MLQIGCHLSAAKGFLAMGKEALSIGANTCQFFTRNPRGGHAKALDLADITAYLSFAQENKFFPLLAHAPYTLNACSADPGLREFARNTMADDLARLSYLPNSLYNFHPGSHVKQGVEIGIAYIAELLNAIGQPAQTTILLETMAGKGSEVGCTFEELRAIIDQVTWGDNIGICLDTCHVWDGSYDIVHRLDEVLEQFDKTLGLTRLKAIHLNDSLNPCGAHKDRHAKIGEGCIGLETLVQIVNHPALRHLPFYLETPNDVPGYGIEIALLKTLYQS